ncbi:MAG TPA: alpha/beta hydrolase [Bryobacteraceae bacterium]|nr:alpha/beta hydrolase [Bryobacteraceae bacterium]
MKTLLCASLAAAIAAAAPLVLMAASVRKPLVLARDSYFFVGGKYVHEADGDIISGQMYVHALIPERTTKPYPIVMIHGYGQSGVNFEGTPDGREGWAQYFARSGYQVYVVDQPARGRSAYHSSQDGPLTPRIYFANTLGMAQTFTAPEAFEQYPQAHFHTQWPGDGPHKGQQGDPIFDQFFASQLESVPTVTGKPELGVKAAGAALLDKIGPAILLTHSQGGAFGWQIADARHGLVKAILSIEPAVSPSVAPEGSPTGPTGNYGITTTPITYDPPVSASEDLGRQTQTAPDAQDLARCWMQATPPRKLPGLAGIPIAVVVAQASNLARTVHCVSKYLTQAGAANDFIRLENVGIYGNAHMMMLEKNSDEIAQMLVNWLRRRGL